MARLNAGDDAALAVIFDQYGSLVHGIAVHLVGVEQAKDVTQEVFMALWRNPQCFNPEAGTLRTYLAVMTRRRAIDEHRRSARRVAREERASNQPAVAPDVEEAAIAMLSCERIREAVALLPEEQARAIYLAYFEGMTFREVAAATSVSEGTAKSRLRLAMDRLARQLATSDGTALSG